MQRVTHVLGAADHHWVTAAGVGNPSTSSASENVDIIRQFSHEEHRRSINDIVGFVDVTYRNVEAVLTSDVNIHRIAGKFVPRHPIRRNSVPKYIKISIMDDPTFMSRVITGDETFFHGYDHETKQQSLQYCGLQDRGCRFSPQREQEHVHS